MNAGTPSDSYLGAPFKLKLPTREDLCQRMREAGKGCYLFSMDVARAYRQLPLDACDYCLTCIKAPSGYYVEISLPFGMRWAAACCQKGHQQRSVLRVAAAINL